MKTVLIVAYLFPPTSTIGGGVIRALKFTKYLPEYGWRPVVLTVRNSFLREDRSALDDIPALAHVIRTLHFDPRYLRMWRRGRVEHERTVFGSGWRKRVAGTFLPDPQIGWFPFAVASGWKAIKRQRVDVLLTTAPPFTDHVVGLALRRLTGLPWVADFRDPWLAAVRCRQNARTRLLERLEERVLHQCAAWTTPTDGYKAAIAAGRQAIVEKGHVIPNGFDSADLPEPVGPQRGSALRLAYGGTLYPDRASHAFFEALEGVGKEEGGVRLLVGQMAPAIRALPVVQRLVADRMIEEHGSLPYREALRRLATFDGFVVTVDRRHPGMVPGKLYEYLALGRPILLLGPEGGDAARLLGAFGVPLVADLDDVQQIRTGLRALLDLARRGARPIDRAALARYDRRRLTGELARLLNRVVAGVGGAGFAPGT